MQTSVFAWIVIVVGVLLVILAALADPLGLGRSPGIGWRQGLGVVIGVVVLLLGLYFRRRRTLAP
jgi:hypothetical protein